MGALTSRWLAEGGQGSDLGPQYLYGTVLCSAVSSMLAAPTCRSCCVATPSPATSAASWAVSLVDSASTWPRSSACKRDKQVSGTAQGVAHTQITCSAESLVHPPQGRLDRQRPARYQQTPEADACTYATQVGATKWMINTHDKAPDHTADVMIWLMVQVRTWPTWHQPGYMTRTCRHKNSSIHIYMGYGI